MDNQNIIEMFILLQIMSFGIIYLERDIILKDWKGWAIDKKIGRAVFLLMPTLAILSLICRSL